mmetsp:Transcript_23726/g.42995  ORF Transcript_23726/g.42995 Transcript_23726/m.42995 type:complete len:608 (+) Transcript_23726:69-1892(+)
MSSSDIGLGAAGKDVEKFSGLQIQDRTVGERRWGELMSGKKYVTLKSLSGTSHSSDIVAIGVVYEKTLPKTSSAGNRFAQWSLTDLAFPEPKTVKLLLFGDALEVWENAEKSPAYSTIIAVLNPVPLPDRGSSSGQEGGSRVAVKVTQSTQIVLLGICPSLGFCSCRKKDGMPCSMPCDKDRGGALVCFYHTLQKEADKVRRFVKSHAAKNPGNEAPKNGLFVLQAAPKPGRSDQPGKSAAVKKEEADLKRFLGPSRLPASPATARGEARSKGQPRANEAAKMAASKEAAKELPKEIRREPQTLPGQMGKVSTETGKSFTERKILALFPGGIPAPDPNRPTESLKELSNARREPQRQGGKLTDALQMEQSQPSRRFGAASSSSARSMSALPSDAHVVGSDGGEKRKPEKSSSAKGMSFSKLEKEFGRRVALQLANAGDPRKDLVRKQESQFQGVVEEERAAKRLRRLAELEVQDEAQAKMEAVISMNVYAYRCQQCCATFEFEQHRANCAEQGHLVTRVEVQKTRWECSSCRQSADVLDRQLPDHCSRCKGMTWKQVPLRKINRTAPMEKDLFLPRGEELPFLNSIHIPGVKGFTHFKEAKDDYQGL